MVNTMKSIYKRYCLIYTNLSKYVKTSNEDKYHRGAKSCSGKWIPERRHAPVPDAMPYGIGQSGRSEQCRRRRKSRADIPAGNALGQKIPVGGHSRVEDQIREWTQAHHQHPGGQGGGKGGYKEASPKRLQSTAAWEEATGKKIRDGAFRNFLSLMAQDSDV